MIYLIFRFYMISLAWHQGHNASGFSSHLTTIYKNDQRLAQFSERTSPIMSLRHSMPRSSSRAGDFTTHHSKETFGAAVIDVHIPSCSFDKVASDAVDEIHRAPRTSDITAFVDAAWSSWIEDTSKNPCAFYQSPPAPMVLSVLRALERRRDHTRMADLH